MAELGCDESQGFLHSRPLAPEAFLDWLGTEAGAVVATAGHGHRYDVR
jgi:EAL domain-containing protein (putative c-di-GMP-specific phosphodiesterase class I)